MAQLLNAVKKVKFEIDTNDDGQQGNNAQTPASGSPAKLSSLAAKLASGQEEGSSSSSPAPAESPQNRISKLFGGDRLSLKAVVQQKILPAVSMKKDTKVHKRRGGFMEIPTKTLDFKNLGKQLRNDEDGSVMTQLWAEVKRRTLMRHQTIERAFRSVDTSGDGAIQFLEFQALIRSTGITLDNRTAQHVFAKAAGGDRELSLEEFKNILMAPTLEKLKVLIITFEENRKAVRGHVNVFLRRVAMASERNRRTMLYRFQRKISTPFCAGLWNNMKKHLLKTNVTEIDVGTFTQVVDRVSSTRFQAYEIDLFHSLFAWVDRRCRGVSDVLDLFTCLTLMASEMTREEKLGFLFQVFDTDDDGCLTHDQILRMYCCAVIHSAIARDDSVTFEADLAFGDEMSLQEARRFFEMTLRALAARGTLDSDARLQSFTELWQVLGQFSEILVDRLVPGTYKAAWLLKRGFFPGSMSRHGSSRSGAHRAAVSYDSIRADKLSQNLGGSGVNLHEDVNRGTLENFRRDLTRSFRHAVRGEWDVVSVLRSNSSNPACTDADAVAIDEEDGGIDLPPWEPPAQGDPIWSEKHRQTLTEWVRDATASSEERKLGASSLLGSTGGSHVMRNSQSLPTLPTIDTKKSTQGGRHSRRMSGSNIKSRGSSSQVASLPNLLPTPAQRNDIDACWQCGAMAVERFGPQAMTTFNHFAQEKAAQGRKEVREVQPVCYHCGLCSEKHTLPVQSDPFQ